MSPPNAQARKAGNAETMHERDAPTCHSRGLSSPNQGRMSASQRSDCPPLLGHLPGKGQPSSHLLFSSFPLRLLSLYPFLLAVFCVRYRAGDGNMKKIIQVPNLKLLFDKPTMQSYYRACVSMQSARASGAQGKLWTFLPGGEAFI